MNESAKYLGGGKLPHDWNFLDGLRYPTYLLRPDGTKIPVENYKQHHQIIQDKFVKSKK